ncbi:hypothetical protein C7S13_4764 [Burkholderia cepacia]|nr:hypothetical protein [Burkholderia cepacia]
MHAREAHAQGSGTKTKAYPDGLDSFLNELIDSSIERRFIQRRHNRTVCGYSLWHPFSTRARSEKNRRFWRENHVVHAVPHLPTDFEYILKTFSCQETDARALAF